MLNKVMIVVCTVEGERKAMDVWLRYLRSTHCNTRVLYWWEQRYGRLWSRSIAVS